MSLSSARWRLVTFAIAATACACSSPAADRTDQNVCTDVGFCDDSVDVCTCDTTCTRIETAVYSCETTCATDAECTSTARPITGEAFTKCVQAPEFGNQSGRGYCR